MVIGNSRFAIDKCMEKLEDIGRILTLFDIERIASLADDYRHHDNVRALRSIDRGETESRRADRNCAIFRLALGVLKNRGKASEADIEQAAAAGISGDQISEIFRAIIVTVLARHLDQIGNSENRPRLFA